MPQTDWTFERVRQAPKQLRQKIRVTHGWQVCILYDDDLPGIFGMAGGRSGKCLMASWLPPPNSSTWSLSQHLRHFRRALGQCWLESWWVDISVLIAISQSVDPIKLACERCLNMFVVFTLCQSSAWRIQLHNTFTPSGFHTCDRCTRWKCWQQILSPCPE